MFAVCRCAKIQREEVLVPAVLAFYPADWSG
jgi:hypothetical protein